MILQVQYLHKLTQFVRNLSPAIIRKNRQLAVFLWSRLSGSDRRPAVYKTAALPAELSRQNN